MKYRELTPQEQEVYQVGYKVGNRKVVITDIEWESEQEHKIYRKGYMAGLMDFKRKVSNVDKANNVSKVSNVDIETPKTPITSTTPISISKGTGNKDKEIKNKKVSIDITKIDLGNCEPIREVLGIWLDYKKDKKQSYANEKSVQTLATRLWAMANQDAETAREIVDQSMANNWAGLFPLKEQRQTFNPDDPEHFKL